MLDSAIIQGMNPLSGLSRTNRRYDAIRLGVLLLSSGFLGLPATVRTLLLCLVMRMGLFVILAAFAAEEKQNFLRVAGTHTDSLGRWRRAVKPTMRCPVVRLDGCQPDDTFGHYPFLGRSLSFCWQRRDSA